MSNAKSPKDSSAKKLPIWTRIVLSRPMAFVARIPPIPWIIRTVTYLVAGSVRKKILEIQDLAPDTRQEQHPLDIELNLIARDIVDHLKYAGAMVAAYEYGGALPARALYVDPSLATIKEIEIWEKELQERIPGIPLSLTDPAIAKVYIHDDKYKDNLGVIAARAQTPVTSREMFDLFTPIAPEISRDFIRGIQDRLGIKQVVTIPFFISANKEYVGNLFVAKIGSDFTEDEISRLVAFSHHAASAIRSERRRLQSEANQKLVLDMQRNIASEENILDLIVKGVVNDLGYTGAMVATYEQGDALPVKGLYVNPSVATMEQINAWEDELRKRMPDLNISLTDPAIARVYIHNEYYNDNLSVKAAQERKPVISSNLFDLFVPIAPEISQDFIKGIQNSLKIRQVIAVPFFLGDQFVGNLFAATESEKFYDWEIELLQSFGNNAAAGINNAKIYKHSENRREAAQILGRMAFSAATNVHAFKNHLGVIRGNLSVLDKIDTIADNVDKRREILAQIIPPIKRRMEDIIVILEKLHTPWQIQPDIDVDVNACVTYALDKLFPSWRTEQWIEFEQKKLPNVRTSQEMLVETFRILIKNANEAILDNMSKQGEGWNCSLKIDSRLIDDSTMIQINVRDNGTGIKPEHFEKVFEMRWSTKSYGLGFGLFWVKDYIEGLGGKIFFASQVDIGTTFIVLLPVAAKHEDLDGKSEEELVK
jgi:signal transduction histidine kinase